MYKKGEIAYTPLPLPDRVQKPDADALKAVTVFRDYMHKRHSVRDYLDRPIPKEIITRCIEAALTAPSGANHQPWHFVAISNPEMKAKIRVAAEDEECGFYAGGAGDEWLTALEPIGTGVLKPHLSIAPWLIVVFAQRYGLTDDNQRYKNYYVPESVGIATGMLITAIHHAGLVCLEHTPNPMKFLPALCGRPAHEKATMIIPVGWPDDGATVPAAAKLKKPPNEVMSVFE